MSQWNLFPQWEARDEEVKQFTPRERQELEIIVSEQVSGLLRDYGMLDVHQIANVVHELHDPETDEIQYIDDSQSFYGIELPAIKLEDDGLLFIGQFPFQFGEMCTHAGAQGVTKVDDTGRLSFESVIWHPSIDSDHRIHDTEGESLKMQDLQELYETLIICTRNTASSSVANIIPLNPAEYPQAIIEPEFEELAQLFYE